MKRFAVLLFLLASLPMCFAQGNVQHFSFSGDIAGLNGAGNASTASFVAADINITPRFALGYERIDIPNLAANYQIGGGSYTMPMTFGSKINKALVFDRSKWQYRFFAGGGVLSQDLNGSKDSHVAGTASFGLNYVADGHLTVNAFSLHYLYSPIQGPLHQQFVVSPAGLLESAGIKVTF